MTEHAGYLPLGASGAFPLRIFAFRPDAGAEVEATANALEETVIRSGNSVLQLRQPQMPLPSNMMYHLWTPFKLDVNSNRPLKDIVSCQYITAESPMVTVQDRSADPEQPSELLANEEERETRWHSGQLLEACKHADQVCQELADSFKTHRISAARQSDRDSLKNAQRAVAVTTSFVKKLRHDNAGVRAEAAKTAKALGSRLHELEQRLGIVENSNADLKREVVDLHARNEGLQDRVLILENHDQVLFTMLDATIERQVRICRRLMIDDIRDYLHAILDWLGFGRNHNLAARLRKALRYGLTASWNVSPPQTPFRATKLRPSGPPPSFREINHFQQVLADPAPSDLLAFEQVDEREVHESLTRQCL